MVTIVVMNSRALFVRELFVDRLFMIAAISEVRKPAFYTLIPIYNPESTRNFQKSPIYSKSFQNLIIFQDAQQVTFRI